MKELFRSYQQTLTAIEQRIAYIDLLMRRQQTGADLKSLRKRRELLHEEYNDLILSLHDMVKYVDDRPLPPIRRTVNNR